MYLGMNGYSRTCKEGAGSTTALSGRGQREFSRLMRPFQNRSIFFPGYPTSEFRKQFLNTSPMILVIRQRCRRQTDVPSPMSVLPPPGSLKGMGLPVRFVHFPKQASTEEFTNKCDGAKIPGVPGFKPGSWELFGALQIPASNAGQGAYVGRWETRH